MNVYCYYEDLGSSHVHGPIIEAWRNTWRLNGWNPVTINETTAKLHPNHDAFVAKVMSFPTVNNRDFELSCYRRHLAMVVIGGGLLCDHDIMNVRFKPEQMPESNGEIQSLDGSGSSTPSFGSVEAWQKLIDFIRSYEPEPTHNSDMTVLQRYITKRHHGVCKTLLEDGWESAPMIHFHNEGIRHRSGNLDDRVGFIQRAMKKISMDYRMLT